MSVVTAAVQQMVKPSSAEYSKHRVSVYQKLQDLAEKVQSLSWSLQTNLIDNYVNFTPTKSLEQLGAFVRRDNIAADFEKVTSELKSLKQKFPELDDDLEKLSKKLEKDLATLRDLFTAVESKRKLERAAHEFSRSHYSDAMLCITDLRKHLQTLSFEGNVTKAIKMIISQAENQYAIYSANVSNEWEDIFSWSEKKGLYHLTYSLSVQQSDPLLIQNILNTLYATERLNYELALFSNFFLEKLLHNVIRHNCDIFTEDVIAPDHTIVFNIKINLEDTSVPNFQTSFNNLMTVFEFLQTTLGSRLDSDKTFMGVFADTIRGKFFDKIIEDCIRNNLPSCDSTYENYNHLVVELDTFNKFLIDLNFVAADQSPLDKFVRDTEIVLYNKKCDKLLNDMRKLLNESLSYGTLKVGSDVNDCSSIIDVTDKDAIWDVTKPLFLPKCVVSQNVKKIMSTIMEYLEESVKLPEKYSDKLVGYIRNIAVMYQCLVPEKFKINLEHCPVDIALFFNNCFYLAHGLTGPPWRAVLPPAAARRLTASLLEVIQDLRVLGLRTVSQYLQTQKDVIVRSVLGDEHTDWSHDTFDQFDTAITDALTLMRDLQLSWHHLLPARMYQLSLTMLAQCLCQCVVKRVLVTTRPVAEELVYALAVRLEDMLAEIGGLFEDPIDFEKEIEVWNRFARLPQLLKAQMLEISRLWRSETALSQTFTCEEVRQIIKMRFPDDKFRLKILVEIQ